METKATRGRPWEEDWPALKHIVGDHQGKGEKHRSSAVQGNPWRFQPSESTHPSEKSEHKRQEEGERYHNQSPDLTPDLNPHHPRRLKDPLLRRASPEFRVRRARSNPRGGAKTHNHLERKQSGGGRGEARRNINRERRATSNHGGGKTPPAAQRRRSNQGFLRVRERERERVHTQDRHKTKHQSYSSI